MTIVPYQKRDMNRYTTWSQYIVTCIPFHWLCFLSEPFYARPTAPAGHNTLPSLFLCFLTSEPRYKRVCYYTSWSQYIVISLFLFFFSLQHRGTNGCVIIPIGHSTLSYLCFFVFFTSEPRYKRVCYYTNWSQYRKNGGRFLPANIDPFLCTHIVFAFAKLDHKGQLAPYEWNDVQYPCEYQ